MKKHYIITENRTETSRVIGVCRENGIGMTNRRLTADSDVIEIECGLFKLIKIGLDLKLRPKFSFIFRMKKL